MKVIEKKDTKIILETEELKNLHQPTPLIGYYFPYGGGLDIIHEYDGEAKGGAYFPNVQAKRLRITIEILEEEIKPEPVRDIDHLKISLG